VIVDAALIIDAVADPGPRGLAARQALADQPPAEALMAPGHFAFEIISGLWAAAQRPGHPLQPAEVAQALRDAEAFEITIEAIPWADVHRAWALAQESLRYADAIYVAAAERHQSGLLTTDTRIIWSGLQVGCQIIAVTPSWPGQPVPGGGRRPGCQGRGPGSGTSSR
jgi:predicted nucleic acid-binding protein